MEVNTMANDTAKLNAFQTMVLNRIQDARKAEKLSSEYTVISKDAVIPFVPTYYVPEYSGRRDSVTLLFSDSPSLLAPVRVARPAAIGLDAPQVHVNSAPRPPAFAQRVDLGVLPTCIVCDLLLRNKRCWRLEVLDGSRRTNFSSHVPSRPDIASVLVRMPPLAVERLAAVPFLSAVRERGRFRLGLTGESCRRMT